jgi:para-nitrobenzyl esterase
MVSRAAKLGEFLTVPRVPVSGMPMPLRPWANVAGPRRSHPRRGTASVAMTNFGNAAIQTVDTDVDLGAQQSEDCLYLNVWSATLDPQARQPVMVWIYGGGFLNGAASMPEWQGTAIAQRGRDDRVVQLPARRIRLP